MLYAPRPEEHLFKKLTDLNVCMIKEGKYVYSTKFVSVVEKHKKKGVSRINQMRAAAKIQRMATTILAYKCFHDKVQMQNLFVTYFWLDLFVKENEGKLPRHHEDLVYATWYLNDHEPEVDQLG